VHSLALPNYFMAHESSIHCPTLAGYNMAKESAIRLHPAHHLECPSVPMLEWHAAPTPVGGSIQPKLKYTDHYLATPTMRIPFSQRAQVDAPLHVIEAAAARLHLPRGYAVQHEQARSPSAYMRVSLWPAQLQRVVIGFTVAASHALATAPASVHEDPMTTRSCGTLILVRVMGSLVGKIQVGTACRARCLCRVVFDARCSKLWWIAGCCAPCTLTSSAACAPPLPSTPGSAMQPVPLSSVAHRLCFCRMLPPPASLAKVIFTQRPRTATSNAFATT
jgi:hypothetical protein